MMSRRAQLVCAWAGPALVVVFLIGCIPLAGFIPPPHPADSAQRIAQIYREHTTSIRLGCLLMTVGLSLIAPWGAALTVWTRRMEQEKQFPTLTYTQVASVAVATVIVVLIPIAWAVAAYRPTDVSPDVTRTWNDFAWFLFLFSWPPFSVWCLAIAGATFGDRANTFPRWIGYLNVWVAILFAPAGLMAFFKIGPFAYNGLITMYMPLAVFFIWMIAMTYAMLGAIKRDMPVAAPERVTSQAPREPTPAGVS
jgi:hypothetical protein